MAKNTQLTNLVVNTQGDAMALLLNSGKLEIFDGVQPATADTALSANNLLCTLTFGATAFGATVAGVMTANAITGANAALTGTASWFRAYKADGTTAVMDGTVGTSAANLIVSTTSFVATVAVSCSAFTHTIAKATAGS